MSTLDDIVQNARAILLISHHHGQTVIPELANCFSVIEETILSFVYLCTGNVFFGLSKLSLSVIISGDINADIYKPIIPLQTLYIYL